jgi:hypothetical protein
MNLVFTGQGREREDQIPKDPYYSSRVTMGRRFFWAGHSDSEP